MNRQILLIVSMVLYSYHAHAIETQLRAQLQSEQQKGLCTICREDIADGPTQLSCNHIFHTQCIDEWLDKHFRCPVCRQVPHMSFFQQFLYLLARMPVDIRDIENAWE